MDMATRLGKFLKPYQEIKIDFKPDWITKWELPYGEYIRFLKNVHEKILW